ncbi:hypothetical protein AGMMS50262_21390 [Bacteroidia bacterium]|nr:hypothetical protein AGMMS50262_21390 [Bacteroidia bacterium]
MYRQVIIPSKNNNLIPIPEKWFGQEVEILVFPINNNIKFPKKNPKEKKLEALKAMFNKYSFDSTNFKFDRDEANNYD